MDLGHLKDPELDKEILKYKGRSYFVVMQEDAPKLLRLLDAERPVIWIRIPRPRKTKSWENIPDLVVLLESKLHGHPLSKIIVGTKTRRSSVRSIGKSTRMGMLIDATKK